MFAKVKREKPWKLLNIPKKTAALDAHTVINWMRMLLITTEEEDKSDFVSESDDDAAIAFRVCGLS